MTPVLTTVGYVIGPILAAFGGALTVHWVFASRPAVAARAERTALRAKAWEDAVSGEPTAPIPVPRPVAVPAFAPAYAARATSGRVAGVAGSIGGAV